MPRNATPSATRGVGNSKRARSQAARIGVAGTLRALAAERGIAERAADADLVAGARAAAAQRCAGRHGR